MQTLVHQAARRWNDPFSWVAVAGALWMVNLVLAPDTKFAGSLGLVASALLLGPGLSRILPPLWRKEFLALAGPWVAMLVSVWVVGAGSNPSTSFFESPLLVVVALGTSLLGASGLGHEFSLSTQDTLMASATSRSDAWRIKVESSGLLVLAFWLGSLACPNAFNTLNVSMVESSLGLIWNRLNLAVALVSVFCCAGWFVLWMRSILAGVVFGLATPLVVLGGGLWLLDRFIRPADAPANWSLSDPLFHWSVFGLLAALAVLAAGCSRAAFLNCQSTGNRAKFGREPARARAVQVRWRWVAQFSRRFPLLSKELYLHRTVWMAAMFLLFLGALGIGLTLSFEGTIERLGKLLGLLPFLLLTILVPSLAGATGVAGERQLGVWDWQLIQPGGFLRPWGIKLSVALFTAVVAGWILPRVLTEFHFLCFQDRSGTFLSLRKIPFYTALFLFAAGWWGSSCSASHLKAIVLMIAGIGSILLGTEEANRLIPQRTAPAALRFPHIPQKPEPGVNAQARAFEVWNGLSDFKYVAVANEKWLAAEAKRSQQQSIAGLVCAGLGLGWFGWITYQNARRSPLSRGSVLFQLGILAGVAAIKVAVFKTIPEPLHANFALNGATRQHPEIQVAQVELLHWETEQLKRRFNEIDQQLFVLFGYRTATNHWLLAIQDDLPGRQKSLLFISPNDSGSLIHLFKRLAANRLTDYREFKRFGALPRYLELGLNAETTNHVSGLRYISLPTTPADRAWIETQVALPEVLNKRLHSVR